MEHFLCPARCGVHCNNPSLAVTSRAFQVEREQETIESELRQARNPELLARRILVLHLIRDCLGCRLTAVTVAARTAPAGGDVCIFALKISLRDKI